MSDQNNTVPRSPHTGPGTGNEPMYGDVAAFLDAGMPEPPSPDILRRTDGVGLFYSSQVNVIFGPPETAKTFAGCAAGAAAMDRGGRLAFLDLDHNSMRGIVTKLLTIGADEKHLRDQSRFRYAEPDSRAGLLALVADLVTWEPDVVVLDSIGELLPALGLNSNSPDDFTLGNAAVLKPLAKAGACVIAIDHVSKHGGDSQGPTGTAAKRRAAGGVMLNVTVKEAFTPGKGGASYLSIYKDRHGGLRARCAQESNPLAGTFVMHPDGSCKVYAPQEGERKPTAVPAADLDALVRLDPPPTSVADVKARMKWRSERAADALRVYRSQIESSPTSDDGSHSPSIPREREPHDDGDSVPVPLPLSRERGTEDRSKVTHLHFTPPEWTPEGAPR